MVLVENIEQVDITLWRRVTGTTGFDLLHSWEDFVAYISGLGLQAIDVPELDGLVEDQEGGRPVRIVRADSSEGQTTARDSPGAMYALVWVNATGKNWLVGRHRIDIKPSPTLEEAQAAVQNTLAQWASVREKKAGDKKAVSPRRKRPKKRR